MSDSGDKSRDGLANHERREERNALYDAVNRALNVRSFFCEAYHSWEKGTVENTNGVIRYFFPKNTNFDTVSEAQIRQVETMINHRSRKILRFISPLEQLGGAITP